MNLIGCLFSAAFGAGIGLVIQEYPGLQLVGLNFWVMPIFFFGSGACTRLTICRRR